MGDKRDLSLIVYGSGGILGFEYFVGTPGPFQLSFINSRLVTKFQGDCVNPGCIIRPENAQQFVRTDGKTSTTQGTIYVTFCLDGDEHTRILNEWFHILGEEDMRCDAILSSILQNRMATAYGSDAVSCATSDIRTMTDFKELSCCPNARLDGKLESHSSCPICFEEYKSGEMISWATCNHALHTSCLNQMDPYSQNNCLNCRATVPHWCSLQFNLEEEATAIS